VEGCDGEMVVKPLAPAPGGTNFRCTKNRNHRRSSKALSFFDKTNLTMQDAMLFIKCYLERNSLAQCARFAGVRYTTTAVHSASFIRELFKEHFFRVTCHRKLNGTVDIDESLFGRWVKFHRGNPNTGLKVSFHFILNIKYLNLY
jgi:hypothetical protein